jgi:hypothetical protein
MATKKTAKVATKKTAKETTKKTATSSKKLRKVITIGDITLVTTARMSYEDNWGKVSEDSSGRTES